MLMLAGSGDYPILLADGVRAAGVKHLAVEAMVGTTSRKIKSRADALRWFRLGEFERSIAWAAESGIKHAMMVGQITPLALFTAKLDARAKEILRSLPVKNAHTIYGAWITELERHDIEMLPASCFMDAHIPGAGVLTSRAPTERELSDIEFGHRAALSVCDLDIGQTLLVKEGMVLAVEAFEGTNQAIKRGARLGGKGAVLVKVAKNGHDMRFDIPVIGIGTLKVLKRTGVTAVAYQAHRLVMLRRDEVVREADRLGIAIIGLDSGLPPAPLRPQHPDVAT